MERGRERERGEREMEGGGIDGGRGDGWQEGEIGESD